MKSDTSCVAGLDTALLSNMTFKPSSPYVSEVGFVCVSACSHADRKSKCSDRLCIISRHYAECGLTPHCTQRRHSSKCQIQACTHTHTHARTRTHTHTHIHDSLLKKGWSNNLLQLLQLHHTTERQCVGGEQFLASLLLTSQQVFSL